MSQVQGLSCSCPRCGHETLCHHCISSYDLADNAGLSKQEEQTIITDEIAQLENSILTLSKKLGVLRVRLSQTKSSIADVPTEILAIIFQYACAPNGTGKSSTEGVALQNGRVCLYPVFICSVSSRWRDVALSTPELWTRLDLTIPREHEKHLALLQLFSERSNGRGLDLSTVCTPAQKGWQEDEDEMLHPRPNHPIVLTKLEYATFIQNSTQIRALKLEAIGYKYTYFFSTLGSQLTELRLRLYNRDYHTASAVHFNVQEFAWLPNLTVLELDNTFIVHAFRMLINCPSLIEFRLHRTIGYADRLRDIVPDGDIVTLDHLKYLEWSNEDIKDWSRVALTVLHTPSLQYFKWTFPGDGRPNDTWDDFSEFYGNLERFLSAASATLTEVHIYFPFLLHREIKDLIPTIIAAAPDLCRLTVPVEAYGISVPARVAEIASYFLKSFRQSSAALPHLQYLGIISRRKYTYVHSFLPSPADIVNASHALQQLTQERRETLGKSSFRVELDLQDVWERGEYVQFKQSVKDFIAGAR